MTAARPGQCRAGGRRRFHHGFGPPWPSRDETVGYPRRSSSQRLGLEDWLTNLTGSEGLDVLPSMEAIYFLGTRSGARSTRFSRQVRPRMPRQVRPVRFLRLRLPLILRRGWFQLPRRGFSSIRSICLHDHSNPMGRDALAPLVIRIRLGCAPPGVRIRSRSRRPGRWSGLMQRGARHQRSQGHASG